MMSDSKPAYKGYLLAAALGAFGGGVLVAVVTKAIPRMFSQMGGAMMANMMAQMQASGCDPSEL